MTPPTSIYLHIPFCKHRCAYCDFNTYAGQEAMIPAYVEALIKEIEWLGKRLPFTNYQSTQTIFFGGGTPSLLSESQFDSVMSALSSAFTLSASAEVTIEANPGTISPEKLDAIRKAGINRISFGVQSTVTEELQMLERSHDFFTVIDAVTTARKAGFDNLNLDLIYALPEQTLQSWQTTVKRILELEPEHISAYALTLEHGTPFGRWSQRGLLPIPDPDLAADMYEWTMDYLATSGYTQYEISNWAKQSAEDRRLKAEAPAFACHHNIQYWRSLPYFGLGAGAHGYAGGYRYSNALRIKTYIDRLTNSEISNLPFPISPAAVNHHKQTQQDDISDYMINNLRLVNAGIADSDFRSRFGAGLLEIFPKEIDELIRTGLLEKKTSDGSEVFRLTKRGRLLGNQVFMRFVN
ncbi:MAG: radical SAM family heme chaperone HemW [Anaerolineales bacterium]|nr:radical SAM family heme chaperone HemW [Anaerolineales bacterium]MCB9145225.1 radical SAM family heme chaperone HemW [Anaerolineales bacterium]